MAQRVLVVGAGVIGLSCAVRLAEAGFEAQVLARDLPAETTSAVAGGLWLPYSAGPAEAVARWGGATYAELVRLHDPGEHNGVLLRDGVLLHAGTDPPRPAWAAGPGPVALALVRHPRPGFASGWATRVPLVDPGRYLPWLVRRLEVAGGAVTRLPLAGLPARGLVVNATGASARAMAPDPAVHPVRGQVVVLENPGLTDWWVDEGVVGEGLEEKGAEPAEPTYVLPRGAHVVVGGTSEVGSWDTEPDPATARGILRRAEAVEPGLVGARVLAHRVGLRPGRPQVRVEAERRGEGVVVHCYGHGGSGYTLSWGCADDVLALVRAAATSGAA